jgi:hypothetical protein
LEELETAFTFSIFFFRSRETGEELLNVQKLRSQLKNVVVGALELFSPLLKKRTFASVESFDE